MMLGLPTKELKQAAVHADETLARADRVLDAAAPVVLETLQHARGIAEDLRAITSRLRALIERPT